MQSILPCLLLAALAGNSVAQSAWTAVHAPGAVHSAAWDPARQTAFLDTSTGTFAWDGQRLHARDLGGSAARGMAFDARQQALLLVGPTAITTWAGAWSQQTLVAAPYQLAGATFEAHRQRLVGLTALGATVLWDGVQWHAPALALAPPARGDFAIAYDPVGQRIVLFGGANGAAAVFGDTWVWDGQWTPLAGLGGPGPRRAAALAFDPANGRLLLYGGSATSTDTWSLVGNTWARLTTSNDPGPRTRATLVHDGVGMLLLDGAGVRDTRAMRLVGTAWQPVDLVQNAGRPGAAAAWDRLRNRALVVGGPAGNTATAQFDLASPRYGRWDLPLLAVEPPQRQFAGLAWSQRDLGLLLFGGATSTSPAIPLGDTWLWNGAAWLPRQPVHAPPPRRGMLLQPDPRGGALLFGGSNGSQELGDQWYWDGLDWTQESPAPMPGPFTRIAGTVDDRSGEVYLSGRRVGTGGVLENWRWDGAAWTQLPAPPLQIAYPEVRIVYEPIRQRIVAWTPIAYEWSGTAWTGQALGLGSLGATQPHVVAQPANRLVDVTTSDGSLRLHTTHAAAATSVGAGCALGPSPTLTGLGRPHLGNPDHRLHADVVTPLAPTFFVLGLPRNELPLGSGCALYVDVFDTTLRVADDGAQASRVLAIPFDPGLRGVRIAAQAAVFDPQRSLFGSLTVTSGLQITIGD